VNPEVRLAEIVAALETVGLSCLVVCATSLEPLRLASALTAVQRVRAGSHCRGHHRQALVAGPRRGEAGPREREGCSAAIGA